MPRRTDIKRILVLGAGPIKIGQACEFDYSGTQACKGLMAEGYEVILVNSNPASIMTDPEYALRTYIEPLTAQFIEAVIERERPQALLPTMGGQTALNLAVELFNSGVLERYGVELIGALINSIRLAEDRELFRSKMQEIGLPVLRSSIIRNMDQVIAAEAELGLPLIVRAAFTLGGAGSGIARTSSELMDACRKGLAAGPESEILLEESAIGWKEIELEVIRDASDNFIVVCSIENVDPMGVHTGDSVTVAPTQTLSDKDFQKLRDASKKIITAIGIECGGANIQFAINPDSGNYVVIEMNPRVSRSSALASKATGYPIARIAAKLAIGLTLDELKNDTAGGISACFEPVIDYVVTKIPRFNFEKFPGASETLGTEMKSVGEAMAIGATFQESIQKALRSLDINVFGFTGVPSRRQNVNSEALAAWRQRLSTPTRFLFTDIWGALEDGVSIEEIQSLCHIDMWFLDNLKEIFELYCTTLSVLKDSFLGSKKRMLAEFDGQLLSELKCAGFSDRQIADLCTLACHAEEPQGLEATQVYSKGENVISEEEVYQLRRNKNIAPVFCRVDSCAAEFPSDTAYFYSSYGSTESEVASSLNQKVVIIGNGPNRIGQGIEFDYCCVQASLALRELGFDSIIVNCNPETVSTDYDASDRLYFEPLTLEDVWNVVAAENPLGVIVQFGGQTPLNLAHQLQSRGARILGTTCYSTDLAEDREQFNKVLVELGLHSPEGKAVRSLRDAELVAQELGYPVLLRPSYVLSGSNMHIVHDREHLVSLLTLIFAGAPEHSVLIDKLLHNAIELDVDAICDGSETIIAGILEHVEEAGVHSGDSSCVIPPQSLSSQIIEEIKRATISLAKALEIVGLFNIQMAIKDGQLFILEVNPRASRTVPFVSKATGIPWARIATRVIMGSSLASLEPLLNATTGDVAVKSVVIPFARFETATILLGPEMRSTGEVMGFGLDFGEAFAKAQIAAGRELNLSGHVLVSATPACAAQAMQAISRFAQLGFKVSVTPSLTKYLKQGAEQGSKQGSAVQLIDLTGQSVWESADKLISMGVNLVLSLTPLDETVDSENQLRRVAVSRNIDLVMTLKEALAAADAIEMMQTRQFTIQSLQERMSSRERTFVV